MSVNEWIVIGGFLELAELYFFLMQRSALEVVRASELPLDTRFALLPGTYKAASLFSYGKWVPLAMLVWHGSWGYALGLWLAGFILASAVPVPHRHFFPMFYSVLEGNAVAEEPDLQSALLAAVEGIDRRNEITERFRT